VPGTTGAIALFVIPSVAEALFTDIFVFAISVAEVSGLLDTRFAITALSRDFSTS
jgi:hypothetical protein